MSMHEKSDRCMVRDEILDHPNNRDLDPHELSALHQRLDAMSITELDRERARINNE